MSGDVNRKEISVYNNTTVRFYRDLKYWYAVIEFNHTFASQKVMKSLEYYSMSFSYVQYNKEAIVYFYLLLAIL